MQSKALLIAVAAFAVTATGVHAFGDTLLTKAGLNQEQITAVHEARELKKAGDFVAARDLLADAGITEDEIRAIHKQARAAKKAMHHALVAGDYEAFKTAAADSPLADIITSEADFAQFKEAHELRRSGEKEAAHALLEELGIDEDTLKQHHRHRKGHADHRAMLELSDEQREAFVVAKQANDKVAMQAILDEAGITPPMKKRQ